MRPTSITCVQCGGIGRVGASGPLPKYCSPVCKANYNRLKARASGRAAEWEKNRIARQEAAALERRQKQEATARPCPYCSEPMTNPRRVQCGASECRRLHTNAKQRAFQQRYKEKHGQYHSRRYVEDQDRKLARDRAREAEMPGRQRYKESNQARDQRRRARKRGATVEYFTAVQVYERDGWICQLCSEPVDRAAAWPAPLSVTLDHRLPLSRGGEHSMANTQCAHWSCNHAKRDKEIAGGA